MSDSEIKKTFSKNFNRLMNLHNKSQKDIADALGYHKATVSEWARGTKYPRMDKVECLANYFNIQISDLIEDKSLISAPPNNDEKDVTKMVEDLRRRLSAPGITYEGKPVTPEEVENLISGIQIGLEIAIQRNKNKK